MKDEKGPYLYAKNLISVGIDVPILNLDNDTPLSKVEDIIMVWSQWVYLVQIAKKWDHAYLFQILSLSPVCKVRNWWKFQTDEQKQAIISEGFKNLPNDSLKNSEHIHFWPLLLTL